MLWPKTCMSVYKSFKTNLFRIKILTNEQNWITGLRMETGEESKEKASSQIVQDNVIIVHNFVQMFHAFAFLKILLVSGHHVYDFDKEEKKPLIIFILCEFPSVAILNAYMDQALNYGGKASWWEAWPPGHSSSFEGSCHRERPMQCSHSFWCFKIAWKLILLM